MHVEQDDVRVELADQRHRVGDGARLADDIDGVAELGAHAGAEEVVVVDEDDAALHDALLAQAAARPRCRRPARS